MNTEKRFNTPFEIEPADFDFKCMGFTLSADPSVLCVDFYYDGLDRMRGNVLRATTDDPLTFKVVNWVMYRDYKEYFANTITYNPQFYNPNTNPFHDQRINLNQIADLVSFLGQLISEKGGIQNIDEQMIFESDKVKEMFFGENN